MKKFIFTAVLISLICNLFAQQEIALVHFEKEALPLNTPKKLLKNALYIEEFRGNDYSNLIDDFHLMIANYDIKRNPIYSNKEKSTYNVVFEVDKNLINATYDTNGIIIKSLERYKNIKLPYIISKQIMKKYPGWSFNDVECTIIYRIGKAKNVSYNIKIIKGNQKKSLSFNASEIPF